MANKGPVRRLQRLDTWLTILTYALGVFAMIYYFYPAPANTFTHTLFPPVGPGGALRSERFRSYWWWRVSSMAFAVLVVMLMFHMTKVLTRARWFKILMLVLLAIAALWWATVVGLDIVFMATHNDPKYPENRASSDAACCAAEYFSTVATCPNAGAMAPECQPPRFLSDMGINPLFVFGFVLTVFMLGSYVGLFVCTFLAMRAADEFARLGDENFVEMRLAETGDAYLVPRSKNFDAPYYNKAVPFSAIGVEYNGKTK